MFRAQNSESFAVNLLLMVVIITEQVPEKLKHKISVLSKGSEQKQSQKTTQQPFSLNGYP